jgi:peptide/nickel transport system substrate-binding protein
MKPASRRGRLAAMLAGIAVGALAATGCSVQVKSEPDPSIGKDTMLINADHGNPLFTRNFNPFLSNGRTAARWIYEPLIVVNPLNGDRTPWLASSWTQPNASTIDMTIRKGVTWSDGSAFTAKDVVFTFDMLKKYPALDIKGAWQHIKSISSSGDQVVFHLKSDDVPSLNIIGATYIVSQKHWGNVKDPTTYQDPDPDGTGPFTLGNYSDQQYSMNRYKGYWQASKVQIQHIILPATNTELDTVTRGYDWGYAFISDVKGTWGAASKSNSWWFPAGGIISLIPNLTKAPFNDVNVRKGISLALNRSQIAETATEGYLGAAGQTGLLLPNQDSYLDPSIPDKGNITQSKQQALAAFAKAGYTMQGNKLVRGGKQLTFSITTANGYSDWLRAVQEVQRELAGIGIKVEIKAPQAAGWQADLNNGQFDMAVTGTGGGDIFQAYNNLLSGDFYQPVGKTTSANFERFKDPQVDALLDQYKSTTDTTKQKQIIQQLENVVYDQVPVVNMYYGGLWGLFSTAKFTGWPSAKNPYMAPQDYDSASLVIFTHLKLAGSGN